MIRRTLNLSLPFFFPINNEPKVGREKMSKKNKLEQVLRRYNASQLFEFVERTESARENVRKSILAIYDEKRSI